MLYHFRMGMETVEIVLEVEETFGISITDHEAELVETVGELETLILSKMPSGGDVCTTQQTFYEVRRIAEAWPLFSRRRFKPSAPMRDVLPIGKAQDAWRELQRATQVSLPKLEHSQWVQNTVGIACLSKLPLLLVAGTAEGRVSSRAFILLGVVGIVSLLFIVFAPRVEPPRTLRLVGDVVKLIALRRHGVGGSAGELVRQKVQVNVAEALGLPVDEVTPDARFIQDLGAG
jgi:acyl carrier protein